MSEQTRPMTALGKLWTDAVAYVALILGAGLSIAGNVADTYRSRGTATDLLDIVMAVAWPALVVLMVEIFVSPRWVGLSWPMQLLRWLGTLSIGGMAMRVSWVHLNDLMASRGQKADVAILGPLAIDCLAIMATALILAGRRGQKVGHEDLAKWVNPEQVARKVWPDTVAMAKVDENGHGGLGQALANSGDVATGLGQWPLTKAGLSDVSAMLAKASDIGQASLGQDLAKAYATVGDEASDYLASLANHPELDTTSTPPAPLPQRTSTERTRAGKYDKAAALAAIRSMLDGGAEGAQIDAAVAEVHGISTRTARRLRAEVSGQPVSGPPDDEAVS
jgi:hypothetical protein